MCADLSLRCGHSDITMAPETTETATTAVADTTAVVTTVAAGGGGDTPAAIPGCTDPSADNYQQAANIADSSCEFWACKDPVADNFDENAIALEETKQAASPLPSAPQAAVAKPAVATLALEAEENTCPQAAARC